jgi:hypothetical protein
MFYLAQDSLLLRLTSLLILYHRADSVKELADDNLQQYPVEYLNSINIPTLPPSELVLKKGMPLMLLRNLYTAHGLCNETRLCLIKMTSRVLEVRIITGAHAGETAFIPWISLIPSEEDLPFKLSRRQFPLRLAFAMTINKSQGQSLGRVGLDLQYPVFSHGQFYVGVSRGTNMRRVHVLLAADSAESVTKNIVYHNVLLCRLL